MTSADMFLNLMEQSIVSLDVEVLVNPFISAAKIAPKPGTQKKRNKTN